MITAVRTARTIPVVAGILAVAVVAAAARAAEEKEEGQSEEPGIRDNSFLIEEAFNQEQGVVQHIFNWVPSWERGPNRGNSFDFVFTQEWPVFSQEHQFSYTLPMLYDHRRALGEPGTDVQGFGDLMLNYRYQALAGNWHGWWAAPRFSVILPTGDETLGLGNGQVGYQVGLPFSKEFKHAAVNLNAGFTITPNVTAGIDPALAPLVGQTLNGYNLGGSVIYFLKDNFNLMLETVALWDEELTPEAVRDRNFQYILSPGFRWAPYTEGSTQWVVGAAVPVGLTQDAPDVSAFLYMSFEHRFHKERK